MDLPLLKLLSLFSGGDGFALAAEEMGWEVIAHCENAFFPQLVIKSRWPNTTLHENIKTTDFTLYRGLIDIITGPNLFYKFLKQYKNTKCFTHNEK